jgi:hypothetical protein
MGKGCYAECLALDTSVVEGSAPRGAGKKPGGVSRSQSRSWDIYLQVTVTVTVTVGVREALGLCRILVSSLGRWAEEGWDRLFIFLHNMLRDTVTVIVTMTATVTQ